MNEVSDDYTYYINCVDDDDPVVPKYRTRGYGGVTTLVKKVHMTNVETIVETNPRIIGLKFGPKGNQLLILNVYMPCRGSYTDGDYFEVVDELASILRKYNNHKCIIAGDLNVNLHDNSTRSKYLNNVLIEFELQSQKLSKPTFYHHNQKSFSTIDYIVIPSGAQLNKYDIQDKSSLNTSTHVPVEAELGVTLSIVKDVKRPNKAGVTPLSRIKWDRIDLIKYREVLEYITEDLTLIEIGSVDLVFEQLTKALTIAAESATPKKVRKSKLKKPWNEEIKNVIKKSREADYRWKCAGKPPLPNILAQQRNVISKQLRAAQRRETARKRTKYLDMMLESDGSDSKTFFNLIKRQKCNKNENPCELIVNQESITDADEILECWRTHFAGLAYPSENSKFDQQYKETVDAEVKVLKETVSDVENYIPLTELEVTEAINGMKNNKAPDSSGIASEHLKYGCEFITPILTKLFNLVLQSGKIPTIFKGGTLTPVHKKGKPAYDTGNYRGITVTSIIGKVFETILLEHQNAAVESTQSDMQFGFTAGCSPAMASLVVTEGIAESRDRKQPLYCAALDACKAFDVVDHNSLLLKLKNSGLPHSWWKLKQDTYNGIWSKVKFNGVTSREFTIHQGVRQGGITSTSDYKVYCNNLLTMAEKSGIGLHIGDIYAATPACADDIIMLGMNEYSLQCLLDLAMSYANQERYIIHPQKSVVGIYNESSEWINILKECDMFHLGDSTMPVVTEFQHLGLTRYTTPRGNVVLANERVKLGRRTNYAMMGIGFHGANGLPPLVSIRLYHCYVLPRILCGLESIRLTRECLNILDTFHRSTMRMLQNLPQRVAKESIYLLTGTIPIEAHLDLRKLSLIGAIARRKGSKLWEIALRQLIMKDNNSSSWFVEIRRLMAKYDLVHPIDLLQTPVQKCKWKANCKAAVVTHWWKVLQDEAMLKSSLKHIEWSHSLTKGKPLPHLIWRTTKSNRWLARTAIVKVRLMTHTYRLQSRINRKEDGTCPLCGLERETETHFTANCRDEKAMSVRENYIMRVRTQFQHEPSNLALLDECLRDPELLSQLAIDHTALDLKLTETEQLNIERLNINYIFQLHKNRADILNYRC